MTRRGALLTVGSLGVIAIMTLWPFAFHLRWLTWADYAAAFGLPPRSMFDFPRNIVLFMPLGAGVAMLAGRSSRACRWAVLLAGAAGLVASASVETLQIFLPGRTPGVADIVANTLGAAAGCLVFRRRRTLAVLAAGTARPPMPRVDSVALGAYALLMVLVVWVLMWGVRPQGWEVAYSAASARDLEGGPSWRGTVSDLVVLDRAVDEAGVARLLAGEIPAGVPPVIVAQSPGAPATISGHLLADRINASGQFTLAATVTTFDLRQEDPAPIVRSAGDLSLGNVSVGQDESHLVLRWRSPLTIANHMEPQLEFPGVFRSLEPQRLVLSFDGSLARVRTADEETTIVLGPEAVFSAMLRETNCWPIRIDRFEWWATVVPLSALMFPPFGALWGPIVHVGRRRRSRMALLAGGLALPAVIVEGFVALYQGRAVRLDILIVGIAFTSLGFVLRRLCSTWRFRRPRGIGLASAIDPGPMLSARIDRV
jgi:hypothetical protein